LKVIAKKFCTIIFIIYNKNLFFHDAYTLTAVPRCDTDYTHILLQEYEVSVKY
jgi:hypothetical protein